ncbi:MAG: sulfurtransferase [Bacteroidia bacterium]|nr:sulfurtransferase [Bacteroidia bacterium]
MFTTLIPANTLRSHLNDPHFRIVDCRFNLSDIAWGENEYRKNHIPGAVYAHLDRDLSSPVISGKTGRHPLPDPQKLESLFSSWGIDAGTQVVVYDQGAGGIAARLWWLLRWLGHDQVAVLDGGWAKWTAAGFPISEEIFSAQPAHFSAQIRSESLIDAPTILEKSPHILLVDARETPRYLGETEPIDPVAGHIPGAKSLPFAGNIGGDGFFHSPEILKQRFETVLGDNPAEESVFYCGSGVTACHNLLAMTHAGLPTGKLYASSWSEWIADPERPVAVGEEN